MTIIAWDGKTLAADGRITCGSAIATDSFNKLHTFKQPIPYINGDVLLHIGVSGTIRYKDQVIAMFEEDDRETFAQRSLSNTSVEHGIQAIVVGRKHTYSLERNSMLLIRHSRKLPLAEGYGYPYAMSAMMLGLDAIAAVKHTIKLDSSCGGRVRWI